MIDNLRLKEIEKLRDDEDDNGYEFGEQAREIVTELIAEIRDLQEKYKDIRYELLDMEERQ